MKKYLALILAIVMSLSLVACGGGSGGSSETPSGGGETQTGGGTASGGDIYVLVPNADHGWTGAVLTYAQQKAEEVNAEGTYNVVFLGNSNTGFLKKIINYTNTNNDQYSVPLNAQ